MRESFQGFNRVPLSAQGRSESFSDAQVHSDARERRDTVRQRADAKVLSWMEKVGKSKRFLQLCNALQLVNVWGLQSASVDFVDSSPSAQEVVLKSPETPPSMRVDSGFQQEGIRPETIRALLEGTVGREAADQNIGRIAYSSVEIPMPPYYRGTQRYEAGHCTRSTHPGERSDVVLTPSAFRGATARQIVVTILHEAAGHALDYHNDERMTASQRKAQADQLHRLVQGDRLTMYDYPNDYEHGSLTPEQEDLVQEEELFATVVADGLTLPVMDANDPLRRLSLRDQMSVRLAQRHDVLPSVAAPYADILVGVAAVRGADFFERGQVAAQRAERAIQAQLNERDHRLQEERAEAQQRQVLSELERLAIPSLSVALQHWQNEHLDAEAEDARTEIKTLDSVSEHEFDPGPNDPPELRRHLAQLEERYDRLMDRLDDDRRSYPQRFMQNNHNPALRSLFERLTNPSEKRFNGLLGQLHTEYRSSPEVVRALVTEFNKIMDVANNPTVASPEESARFREAILRYTEDVARGGYYQHVRERIPELSGVVADLDEISPTDPEVR